MNKQEDLISLGARIKQVRKHLNLLQKDFAGALNISSTYLSEIETGKGNPGFHFFLSIASTYNVNVEFLFFGNGEIFGDSTDRRIRRKADNCTKFLDAVHSLDDLLWLLDNSITFRNTVLGFSAKYFYENKELLKEDIMMLRKKETESESE